MSILADVIRANERYRSFIDQQASRLQYRVEDIGPLVSQATSAARIAGRCSVFAKSDMIHAQQRGYSTGEVLKGLCEAVGRNFKSNIVKGRKVIAPGLAHTETITTFHNARFMAHPQTGNCLFDGNPLHQEQLEVVRMLGGAAGPTGFSIPPANCCCRGATGA